MPKYIAALAAAIAIVACGGGDGSTTPKQAGVSTVTMSQTTATMDIGATVALTATPKDASGNTLTGRATTWSSTNTNVASVSNGSVTALSVGTATITATIDGKSATTVVTVHTAAVATVTVTPPTKTIIVGGTATLTATTKDANNNLLDLRAVTWSSSDETKVTVTQGGVVTGHALGTATITATSETKTGTSIVTVSDGTAPLITSISPDTMVLGVTVTITGSGFTPTPQGNIVTVGGTPVGVTAASATQLSFVLPGSFPCLATQDVSIVVTTDLGSGTSHKPLRVATRRTLGVGESLMLTDVASLGCNELPQTGGRYLMSVYNSSTAPSATSSFEVRGNMGSSVTPAIVSKSPSVALSRAASGASLSSSQSAKILQQRDRDELRMREHARLLEEDRALVKRLGPPRRYGGSARRSASSLSLSVAGTATGTASSLVPVPLTVGAMATLKFPKVSGNCTTSNTVRARVVYVGTRSVVLEDSIAPLRGTMDADLSDVGQEFDNVMFPILTQNFGDPLAFDSETDNNQRILMLFTPRVDSLKRAGLQGFVRFCDYYPPAADTLVRGSNQAEIFYARLPKNSTEVSGFRRDMKGTVIHEAKHITMAATRFASPDADVLEESWLEEGTAQIASELYARTRPQYAGVTWKSNATYRQSVYCDVRPTWPECNGAQYLIADHMFELHDYYRANETKSFLSPGNQDVTIYGSAWKFARWATDQYATSESAFLKSLVAEPHLTGVANVADKTHHSFEEMDGLFTLALLADDYPGAPQGATAKYTFPSWNIPDIFSGMAADFPSEFVGSPLRTHFVTFGDFAVAVPKLVGGSGSLFNLSGTQTGPQTFSVRAPGGGAVDPFTSLRLVILRVE